METLYLLAHQKPTVHVCDGGQTLDLNPDLVLGFSKLHAEIARDLLNYSSGYVHSEKAPAG